MLNYWISWIQPTEDNRPLTYPPNEGVLGWWCTGQGEDYWTMCAMVRAENKEQAEQAIFKDWPEAEENKGLDGDWRIFDEDVTLELGDRFPLSDWMEERFEKASA